MERTVKILLIEDNKYDAELILRQISKNNIKYTFKLVSKIDDFSNAIDEYSPDIILSDFNLVGFTGLDALELAKEKCIRTPFIIVTGTIDEETAAETIKQGAWDYVVKERLSRLDSAMKNALQLKEEKEKRAIEREEFRLSEERFELAMKAAKDGLYDWNLITNEIYYSPGWKSMLGYEDHELPNKLSVWEELIDQKDAERSWKMQKELINKQRKRFELEFKMKHKDEHFVDILSRAELVFDEAGKAIRMIGTHVDISEQKLMENELIRAKENAEENAEKLNKSQKIGKFGHWEFDFKKAETNWSDQIFEMYDRPKELGSPSNDEVSGYYTEEDHLRLREYMQNIIETKKPEENFECPIILPCGTIRQTIGSMFPVFNNSGEMIKIYGVVQDVTQRKKEEQELITAKEKAEESDRLKSAFLANMSHEIRTPMNGILGFAGLLKTPNLSGENQQKYIGIIQKSGNRMLNIINDIVSISKIESGLVRVDLKVSNINEQVEFIYNFFQPEVENKELKFSFNTALPSIESNIKTDREKVYAILTNLVKNAIKYTDAGSLEFGYQAKNNFLEFYVKDTGIGIPKSRQKAIFERFIQADIEDANAYQGAGLGLAISSAYVKMLGGEIWVESEEGKGSCFYFTLPFTNEALKGNEANNETLITDESLKINNLKILIAEDDEASQQLITIYVDEYSNNIRSVKTGTEAVSKCRENPDINLILMDVLMPEMDGLEATRQIRKFNTDVTIIAQTAFGLQGDKEKAIAAGCDDYISKPIKKQELDKMIERIFQKNNN